MSDNKEGNEKKNRSKNIRKKYSESYQFMNENSDTDDSIESIDTEPQKYSEPDLYSPRKKRKCERIPAKSSIFTDSKSDPKSKDKIKKKNHIRKTKRRSEDSEISKF